MKRIDLNTTSDAREWARQFVESFPECEIDPDTVVTWFASALHRSYHAGYRAGLRDSTGRKAGRPSAKSSASR